MSMLLKKIVLRRGLFRINIDFELIGFINKTKQLIRKRQTELAKFLWEQKKFSYRRTNGYLTSINFSFSKQNGCRDFKVDYGTASVYRCGQTKVYFER